jgi:hypothetical protein
MGYLGRGHGIGNALSRLAVLLVVLAAGLGGPASVVEATDTPAYVFGVGAGSSACGVGIVEGWEFHVNSDIVVTGLGVFDSNARGPGLVGTHEVRLFTSAGTVLAAATVPAGTAADFVGGSRFVPISAIALTTGSNYVLGATYCFSPTTNDDTVAFGDSSLMFNSAIAFVQGRRQPFVSSFVFPPPGSALFGPNLLFKPAGPPLSANAGPDQSVNEGVGVSLDGSASTGSNPSFLWTQLAGPSVTLNDANTTTPSFTTPLLAGGFGTQTLTFSLTVGSGSQSSSDTVDVTVVNVNHAPMADAGAPQIVQEGSAVGLSGTASFDVDGDPITYQWTQTSGPTVSLTGPNTAVPTFTAPLLSGGVGTGIALEFEIAVSDGALSSTSTVTVTVEQNNHAPVADAGAPQTVSPGTLVTLDGAASDDPDNDAVGFAWVQVGGPTVTLLNAATSNPSFTAPPANGAVPLTFRLTVSDGELLSQPADVVVTVNNGPPLCQLARAEPSLLWPPNHKMVPISIVGVTDPNNSPVAITVIGVTQDEPVNGLGDGDSAPDAAIAGGTVLVRSERSGTGNGRVYEVQFTADDGQGGVCAGAVTIAVPHSKRPGETAGDDGQSYDSTGP